MRVERPRAARYPFVATTILTNLETSNTTKECTKDLSLYGCRLVPGISTPAGTRVRIQIAYKGQVFEAFGQVAQVRDGGGVGIVFTKIEPGHQVVLDEWIAELRNANAESLVKG